MSYNTFSSYNRISIVICDTRNLLRSSFIDFTGAYSHVGRLQNCSFKPSEFSTAWIYNLNPTTQLFAILNPN